MEMEGFQMKNNWKLIVSGVAITSVLFIAPTVEATSTYTVKEGDTLFKIAKTHNATIHQLKQWNELASDRIYIAQKLVVTPSAPITNAVPKNKVTPNIVTANTAQPNKVAATNTVVPAPVEISQTANFHIVIKGDNLTKIAQKYNVSIASLQQWNDLMSDTIFIGQKLSIKQLDEKDLATEAPTASVVEAVIQFKQTADEAIEKQLNSEIALAASVSAPTRDLYTQAIQIANAAIGTPYKYGGTTLDGFDCSGFVSFVYNLAGIPMDRKSSLMYFGQDTTKVVQPVPGDFVFFKNTFIPTISHMGIYIGNDEFIHAGSKGVTISNVNEKYWAERFVAYKRMTNLK